ncbi:MAG: phosphate acyltransferase [Zetaproteobacteria bacterium]|nr:MAG: phosphate acyltransferase [Zetaproteobacteria bacterium]
MGGDFGPKKIIPALDLVLQGRPEVYFLVYGDENEINQYLSKYKLLSQHTTVFHTDKMILNDEKPSAALRASKGSGMRMAIEAVKSGEAEAVVSAGNTGALMALAKIVLKTVPGIHRPAIASVMPGVHGDTVMLDLGANVLVDADTLVQFAVLGSVFARANKKRDDAGAFDDVRPTVGLLNIGSEDTKGPEHVRAASEILSRIDFPGEYKGFVEGNDITRGTVDVIVCDGYAGNISLKTAEGVGHLVRTYLKESFKSSALSKIGAFFAYFALKSLRERMDPRRHNGGVFLGLNGVCIKSHGGADALSFSCAVILAVRLTRQGYIEQIVRDIGHLTDQENFLSRES